MGIGASVFLLAIGAILSFAVEVESSNGFNINTIGIILMIAGAIGLLWSLITAQRATYVEDQPVVRRRVYE